MLPGSPAAGHPLRPDTAAFVKRLRRYAVSSTPGAVGAAADASDDKAVDEVRRGGSRWARCTFLSSHTMHRGPPTRGNASINHHVYIVPTSCVRG